MSTVSTQRSGAAKLLKAKRESPLETRFPGMQAGFEPNKSMRFKAARSSTVDVGTTVITTLQQTRGDLQRSMSMTTSAAKLP